MRHEALLVGLISVTAMSSAMALADRGEPPSPPERAAFVDEKPDAAIVTTTTTPPPPATTTTAAPAPMRVRATSAPTEHVAPAGGTCAGQEGAIAARWPADQVGRACRVMMCESGGSPTAQNPRSSASGLWQFLDGTWAGYGGYSRAMYAPIPVQHDAAFALWQRSGWSPWSCR